jgi:acetoacetyl-CoA synthetase
MTTAKLWEPSAQRIDAAQITAFARRIEARHGVSLPDYEALWRWSIDHAEAFWREVWNDAGLIGEPGERVLVDGDRMPGARWFPDAKLNYAENLLRGARGRRRRRDRVLGRGQDQAPPLPRAAAPDRVAAFLPNLPETVIGHARRGQPRRHLVVVLAGLRRAGRARPLRPDRARVLFTVDGYFYNGKPIDPRQGGRDRRAAALVERVVVVPYLGAPGGANEFPPLRGVSRWGRVRRPVRARARSPSSALPFDHPLYILYSSGTTGVPKCIVHGAGGTLLQHLKEHQLHCDLRPATGCSTSPPAAG